MLTGINFAETRPYTSKLDKGPDGEKTVFQLGVLDPFCLSAIDDSATSMTFSSKNPDDPARVSLSEAKKKILAVKLGLRDMENFLDPRDGKPVRFDTVSMPLGGRSYKVVTDSIIQMFSMELIKELAAEILQDNKLSEEEEKN